jgi:[acyl-carrier-protein] S-malonyltransferase
MSLALLFPGQGTQHPAMLPWLDAEPEAAPTLAALAAHIGADWRERLADSAWATDNAVAQVLLTGLSIAAWQCLAPRLPAPAAIAGYSVGELPAFCAAGVFDAGIALDLAQRRADAMAASVRHLDTGLLAVQGLGEAAIDAACRQHGLAVAIRMAPDRAVLGGLAAALIEATVALERAGARCTRLAIGLASHTPWMAAAAHDFALDLAPLHFAAPRTSLVCNLTGAAVRGEPALRAALSGQIAAPVQWERCLDTLAERGLRCVLEVGPGSSLSRLWNERQPTVPARSIDEFRSPGAVAQWVRSRLA